MNVSVPTWILNKQHNTIFSHRVWELQATGKTQVKYIPCERNLADSFMKTTMVGKVRHYIMEVIFHKKLAKWKADKTENERIGWG